MPSEMQCSSRCFINLVLFTIVLLVTPLPASSHGDLALPALRAPEVYGDVMIDRSSVEKKVTPVVFSHWVHRVNYTCRVCHTELEFAMKANETGIVCNNGTTKDKYCFVCHNGKTVDGVTAFASTGPEGENCKRCHNADASPNRKKFEALKSKLPSADFGNEIDWVRALTEGKIKPKKSLLKDAPPIALDRTLTLQAEMIGIPPAIFSHKIHTAQLDCSNCHPEIFNIKKKTTKHFSMSRIFNNEFCGVCHLRIAFPLNDCRRCHPGMKK
jgi:c(7)-type cytochrome triheme protein